MSKHTPAPWKFIDATQSASYKFSPNCIIKSGNVQIASFSWNDNSLYFPTKEESQANARLIAASPDLLEALKDMNSGWKYLRENYGDLYGVGWDRAQVKADAAIAKAEVQP